MSKKYDVFRHRDDRITYDDSDNTYRFTMDDQLRLEITVEDNNCVINMMGHGTINSNGDLRVYLDKNEETQRSNAKFKIFNGMGHEIFSLNESGESKFMGGEIVTQRYKATDNEGQDTVLEIGADSNNRGKIIIHNQPEIHADEFSLLKKPGVLVLYDADGKDYFLWVDTHGRLKFSRSDPQASDTSGTVIVDI